MPKSQIGFIVQKKENLMTLDKDEIRKYFDLDQLFHMIRGKTVVKPFIPRY